MAKTFYEMSDEEYAKYVEFRKAEKATAEARKQAEIAKQDAVYANEPWAKLAVAAGFRPWDTESSARHAFCHCVDLLAEKDKVIQFLLDELTTLRVKLCVENKGDL